MKIKNVWERLKENRWARNSLVKDLGEVILYAAIFSVIFWVAGNLVHGHPQDLARSENSDTETSTSSEDEPDCNVLGINVHGDLVTYIPQGAKERLDSDRDFVASEDVTGYMRVGNNDNNIKAIILEIDSPGGEPVAGEEIADAVHHSTKPVIGLIRQTGASAAYWAVSPAEKIFASQNSDVGSIGVTASYNENVASDTKFIQLSVGKYKDSFNPDKPITEDEKALMLRDLKIIHENFIQAVAKNRHLSIEKVRSIADGSTVLGTQAKQLGLIDELGTLYNVEDYLQTKLGDTPVICWK